MRKIYLAWTLSSICLVTASLAGAQANSGLRKVYLNEGHIVLEENGVITKFFTPKRLVENGQFSVRIKNPPADTKNNNVDLSKITLDDKIEARRIMHEANQTYFDGKIAKTWELVEKAENLDPTYYRIKTMKGSLLFKIGSAELAREVWQESLQQNPNQPEIVAAIRRMDSKQQMNGRTNIARGVINPANKEAVSKQ